MVAVTNRVVAVTAVRPTNDTAELWRNLRERPGGPRPTPPALGSVMETEVCVLAGLSDAPPRTLHNAPLVKSSPLSPTIRAMLEAREFGRRFDTVPLDTESVRDRLPGLRSGSGDVQFLAADHSLEDLSLSVEGLLQHRKRLLAPTLNPNLSRRHVLVIGAGPAGFMAAIELSLRNHHVVVCEQREVYSRNRYIGVYKEVTHLMAALGMPERMTYDFSQYRGKRGIMLADIQTLLHGIALKLGVLIYTGAVAKSLELEALRAGQVELQRAPQPGSSTPGSIGLTRWQHDSVSRVSSGVVIRFDTVIEASGGRSGLREVLVGKENVVPLHDIGLAAVREDPTLDSFFDDPEDHSAEYVDSDYGCPPGLRPKFAQALKAGQTRQIPAAIPCFVSNIDAGVFTKHMHQADGSLGLASRVGDRQLSIPHDWVVLECRLADQSLSRYHIEGPLPQTFEFGGKRVPTPAMLDKLNPVAFLVRILYAMGVPFDAVDRRQLIDFYNAESSYGDASDIVSTWIGRFRGLRLPGADRPIWYGHVPGSDRIEYAIIGEALQNAWYRFGVGVDDAFTGAAYLAECLDLQLDERLERASRLERVMQSRAVQILYHLYAVARNEDQGVVGAVLTEYQMEERHAEDLAEARLREIARDGAEMQAAAHDLRAGGSDSLLEAALGYLRDAQAGRAMQLLESFPYSTEVLAKSRRSATAEDQEWRSRTFVLLEPVLAPHHQALLAPLFDEKSQSSPGTDRRLWQERLLDLASGRYRWVTPWLRACALNALDSADAKAGVALATAAEDRNAFIAEVAERKLQASGRGATARFSMFDKVLTLKQVPIFRAIPHQMLVDVASLLTERRALPNERIIEKGEIGDALFVIAAGRVRVHDGERTLREMSHGEAFGELSLLDAEPRSASVSAVHPSLLLRLAQSDFYALMKEQPAITRAVNRVLCQLIRTA